MNLLFNYYYLLSLHQFKLKYVFIFFNSINTYSCTDLELGFLLYKRLHIYTQWYDGDVIYDHLVAIECIYRRLFLDNDSNDDDTCNLRGTHRN